MYSKRAINGYILFETVTRVVVSNFPLSRFGEIWIPAHRILAGEMYLGVDTVAHTRDTMRCGATFYIEKTVVSQVVLRR